MKRFVLRIALFLCVALLGLVILLSSLVSQKFTRFWPLDSNQDIPELTTLVRISPEFSAGGERGAKRMGFFSYSEERDEDPVILVSVGLKPTYSTPCQGFTVVEKGELWISNVVVRNTDGGVFELIGNKKQALSLKTNRMELGEFSGERITITAQIHFIDSGGGERTAKYSKRWRVHRSSSLNFKILSGE